MKLTKPYKFDLVHFLGCFFLGGVCYSIVVGSLGLIGTIQLIGLVACGVIKLIQMM